MKVLALLLAAVPALNALCLINVSAGFNISNNAIDASNLDFAELRQLLVGSSGKAEEGRSLCRSL